MLPAASSMRALSPSGSRSEIRAVSPRRHRTSAVAAGAAAPAAREEPAQLDDELRVAAAEAQLDGPGSELGGDLLGSGPEGVDEHEADRRVERREQTVGGAAHVVSGDLGSGADSSRCRRLDVRCQLHDVSMTSQ